MTVPASQAAQAGSPDEVAPLLPTLKQPFYTSASSLSLSSGSSSESSRSSGSYRREDVDDARAAVDDARAAVDEEEARPAGQKDDADHRHIVKIISVLLIGIFVANADGSILMATHPLIASEFHNLTNSSWLVTSFMLAGAATQSLYGKLSDIYGRKAMILTAYSIFAIGCGIVGAGQSMGQVLLGRVISGAGGSGMSVLVSIIITDLLPLREVAQWRAYVNVVATTGRSLGGPLGGWLADVIGWRWSFYGQVPLIAAAIALCAVYLPNSLAGAAPATAAAAAESDEGGAVPPATGKSAKSAMSRLRRIDFRGSFLFALSILALLLPMELGGAHLPWSSPVIAALFAASAILLALFVLVEKRAEEPILPLEIFHQRDAVMSYVVMGLQGSAQVGMMFLVPLYFQVTARTSNTEAGAHLFPAVVGNAVGGLVSGAYIKRSGKYKPLCIFATISSASCYLLLMLRWHGHTNWLESLYIIPGGFGTGIAQSALFISLQAVVDAAFIAPAISMMYLATSISMMTGLVSTSAVMQTFLRPGLERRLAAIGLDAEARSQVISRAVSDVGYVNQTRGPLKTAIVASYVDSLWWSHGVSLLYSVAGFVVAVFLRQKRLDRPGR